MYEAVVVFCFVVVVDVLHLLQMDGVSSLEFVDFRDLLWRKAVSPTPASLTLKLSSNSVRYTNCFLHLN